MENRWTGLLKEHEKEIEYLSPSYLALKIRTAVELQGAIRGRDDRVLEIGVGAGDLTKYLLEKNPYLHRLDAVDVSSEMLDVAREVLPVERVNLIHADALEFLLQNPGRYDAVVSSETVHNFPWEDKRLLFGAVDNGLRERGEFIIMDKIYPDSAREGERFMETQFKRYRACLSEEVAEAIISHELQDAEHPYRMDETKTIDELIGAGFKEVEIVDRIERDVVMVAEK
jgi:ubiquinone/menaquinone biosynthesis C-methylase UbiE